MSTNDSTEASTAPPTRFSSTVDLEVDPSSLTLGGSPPRPPRHIDETSPRMAMNQFGRWRVSVDVITLTHGTYGVRAESATLVVLRVRLNGDSQGASRLSMAKIKLQIRPAATDNSARHEEQATEPESVRNNNTDLTSEAGSSDAVPTFKSWAPVRKIFDVEAVSSEVTQGVNAGLSLASIIGAVFNLGMQRSVTQVFEREVGSEIRGEPKTSNAAKKAGLDIDDTVTWDVLETPITKAGVPLELRLGAVVAGGRRRGGPLFHATLTAKVETGWGLKLFGKPWSKPQPLVIRDDVSFVDQSAAGLELRGRNYETLEADEWSVLLGS
ncbi:hypothetical protein CEP54_009330 [Fusarium duplospermum]|uniref:Uncharacterized protein n=1 Tax=Fusarium duplospermum TaxID=1325734 RepID=A0A428PR40_9HYPO|nr:hypothetical protein CEP54_009330 [Fusarium duplospermum]